MPTIDEYLKEATDMGASDIHITVGLPPMIRMHGLVKPLKEDMSPLTPPDIKRLLYEILSEDQQKRLESEKELDISYGISGVGRFRVNVYYQRGSLGAALRTIPMEIPKLETLGLPVEPLRALARKPRGFILVTGPTGSGKSTTLASLIDIINEERQCHIMTIEDPIEYLHKHKNSIINQRELGQDTLSFANALKHVLRQDPDVILVGEMRDLETIAMAITAAETGHLVFSTLHTSSAPQTIDRIIDVFPPYQQQQIRIQLSEVIEGVVAQQLLLRSDGQGRVVATEIMMATPAVRNLIREGKSHQLTTVIQTSLKEGMRTMDYSLSELYGDGKITLETALERAMNQEELLRLLKRTGKDIPININKNINKFKGAGI